MALRITATVFVLGVLAMWLVAPVGNPCPDLGKLPPGSTSSSAPSFSPPLTRMCTYRTADGTRAQARYVPWVSWLLLALIAGAAGAAAGSAMTTSAPRRQRPGPAPQREPSGPRDEAERERARRERARRDHER